MSRDARTWARGVTWTRRKRPLVFKAFGAAVRSVGLFWTILRMAPLKPLGIVVAAAWVVLTYGTPHLRWTYEYRPLPDGERIYLRCSYVGARAFELRGSECPFVVWRSINSQSASIT